MSDLGDRGLSAPEGHRPALSLIEALVLFEAEGEGDPKRVRMIARDVRAACKTNAGLGAVEANGHALRFPLQKLGCDKRNQNIRSSVRALLRWTHANSSFDQRVTRLSDDWLRLLENGRMHSVDRWRLSRLGRYCSRTSVKPTDISDAVIAKMMDSLIVLGTMMRPRTYHRALVNCWNRNSDTVAGWPETKLTLPPLNRPPQRTPSLEKLGCRMAGQVVALKEFLSGKALTVPDQKRFDRRRTFEGGPQKKTRPLAPVTIDSYLKQIRRAIRIHSELSSRSYDVIELFEIVDCDAAENILNRHAEELEKSGKGSRGIHLMACALLCLGRRYFNVPKDHEDTLHWLLEQVEVPEPKMTLKNVERLRALVISKQHQLLRLPGELIQYTLKRIKSGTCQEKHLVDAQVAVAIAILLSIPMREKNLASIRLGVNLTLPTSNGTEGRVFLAADAVKSRVEVDRFIPADVSGLLRIYVRQVLPLIRSNPTSTALFPGRLNDSTRGPAHLGTQVSRRIAKNLGIEMNVHLFRHFAAVMYLEEHPGDYEVVRLLLGNRNLQIVKDFYTGVEQEAAFRKADAVMLTKKHLAGVNPLNMAEPLKRHSSRRRIRRFI